MKSFLLLLGVSIIFFSCEEKQAEQKTKVEKIAAEIPEEDTFDYDTLAGMYMADFGGSPIRISLNYVSGSNVIGFDLHKGLQRNITGDVSRSGDSIQMILTEPGDNKYDGVFTLNFTGIDNSPTGVWVANDENIPSQEFTLKKIDYNMKGKDDEINIVNFAEKLEYLSDSIGEYHFMADGFVTLKYYPDTNKDWDDQQMEEIKGSWDLNGDKVTINWEPNNIFKGNRLDLTIHKYGDYEYSLKGQGDHQLWMMWY
jgi:hypothetical protein